MEPWTALEIEKLALQRDAFRAKDSSRILDDHEVERDQIKSVDLVHFKRLVVTGTVRTPSGEWPFEIIVSTRGNIVTFRVDAAAPVTARALYWMIDNRVNRWNHNRTQIGSDQYPFVDVDENAADPVVATTRDAWWLADVFHHIRDGGGFRVQWDEWAHREPRFVRAPTRPTE